MADLGTVVGAQISCSAKVTQTGACLKTKTLALRNGVRGLIIYKTHVNYGQLVNKLKCHMASQFNIYFLKLSIVVTGTFEVASHPVLTTICFSFTATFIVIFH